MSDRILEKYLARNPEQTVEPASDADGTEDVGAFGWSAEFVHAASAWNFAKKPAASWPLATGGSKGLNMIPPRA